MPQARELAHEYHRNLPSRMRDYLRDVRGISDAVINRHLLGWNGRRITILILGVGRLILHAHVVGTAGELLNMRVPCAFGLIAHFFFNKFLSGI
jgi:hypothetical protein